MTPICTLSALVKSYKVVSNLLDSKTTNKINGLQQQSWFIGLKELLRNDILL